MICWICGKPAFFSFALKVDKGPDLITIQHENGITCKTRELPTFDDKSKNPIKTVKK